MTTVRTDHNATWINAMNSALDAVISVYGSSWYLRHCCSKKAPVTKGNENLLLGFYLIYKTVSYDQEGYTDF